MKTIKAAKRLICYSLATLFIMVSVQAPALADVVSTEQLVMESKADARKAEIASMLQRSDVQQQLVNLGVDPVDAQQRIGSLTDSELELVYEKLDELPAGEGALGVVIGLLVIFMLLDIAGVTDIFPGI